MLWGGQAGRGRKGEGLGVEPVTSSETMSYPQFVLTKLKHVGRADQKTQNSPLVRFGRSLSVPTTPYYRLLIESYNVTTFRDMIVTRQDPSGLTMYSIDSCCGVAKLERTER